MKTEGDLMVVYVLIFFLAILCVTVIYFLFQETTGVQIKKVKVDSKKVKDRIKILHLSDIHFKREGIKEQKIIEVTSEYDFDLVVFTGDYIKEKPKYLLPFSDFLQRLKFNCPAFAVTGNHDYRLDISKIEQIFEGQGIELLLNRTCLQEVKGTTFKITGVEDPVTGHDDLHSAFKAGQNGEFNLLLAHSYDILDFIEPYMEIDLLLAGDTHGGQLNVGRKLTKALQRFEFLAGKYEVDEVIMYITRGIGTSLFPFRFRARPEITILELYSKKNNN